MAHTQTRIDESLPSATQRTLGITELLEAILVQLPMKDLLLAQRVNKDWQATIVTSKKLQERLFLRPISTQILDHYGGPSDKWRVPGTGEVINPSWNPLLEELFDCLSWSATKCLEKRLPHRTWHRPEASWRQMLRSQPPSRGILVIEKWQDESGVIVLLKEEDVTASKMLERISSLITSDRQSLAHAHPLMSAYLKGRW